ncbi:MAG: glycoside hydrolase family 2 [Bacteroidales bacterium]|nr:glycoside hydrolase family 2 [Bacteroidales bacterium]
MNSVFRNFIILIFFTAIISCTSNREENFVLTLEDNWTVISSEEIQDGINSIMNEDYHDSLAFSAKVPTTVLNALVENNVYSNIFYADNFDKIPREQFQVPWWYIKKFNLKEVKYFESFRLVFDGINYRANIFLNGTKIANADSTESPFRQFDIDISSYIEEGENMLAVEVFPPEKGDLTIGFVDWNPTPPDNNMGIWREVHLRRTGEISLEDVFVQSSVNLKTLDEAQLTISAGLYNHTDRWIHVLITGKIEDISVEQDIELEPYQHRTIYFTPDNYKQLKIMNPRLWWPNNLGDPEMYDLEIKATVSSIISDRQKIRFGIRDVSESVNEDGYKLYSINGQKLVIKGAGWVDDILLADPDEKVRAQVEYARHMNLNTLRLEGFWGRNKTLYNAADENGILLMIGWSCHWEWTEYCGRPQDDKYMSVFPADFELQTRAYNDQVLWLRNHPGVFLWVYGSDKLPLPELEIQLNEMMSSTDASRPVLVSCRGHEVGAELPQDSEISGPVGVKMRGPYDYVTPNYWYIDTNYGGAYGFNTETGPGPQVPPIESIKRMIPEDRLWPVNDLWEFHCGRNTFHTLDRYLLAFNERYGESDNAEDFAGFSQVSNYEAIRAMFEAFSINKFSSTGIIQWMYNSAWPEMYWQLFDWYLMPNGAFYGTRKACEPLHLAYNYGNEKIYLINDYNKEFQNVKAKIVIVDVDGNELFSGNILTTVKANTSLRVMEIPEIDNLTGTYFLVLDLEDPTDGKKKRNFYWLSTKEDVPDFEKTNWFYTPNKGFADFRALRTMEKATIDAQHNIKKTGDQYKVDVTLKNTSDAVAFFIELKISDSKTGETILPVFWDDNYISLLPGEEFNTSATFSTDDLKGDQPVFRFSGINL